MYVKMAWSWTRMLFSASILVLNIAFQCASSERMKMIIDTDPGFDDAFAIVAALGKKNVDVLALTCPDGNADVQNVAQNAYRILSVAQRTDIPVYKGSPLPLMKKYHYRGPGTFFGKDGFGDVLKNDPMFNSSDIENNVFGDEHAAVMMAKLVSENPGEVVIVALGPLTNIAIALTMDPNFAKHVKELHLMGGSMTALGNESPLSEFNIVWDPEAANIVFNTMEAPIYVSTWDLCVKYALTEEQRSYLLSSNTKLSKFLQRLTTHSSSTAESTATQFSLCDSLAMTYALDRTVAFNITQWYTTVELCGDNTRGLMVVDRAHVNRMKPNAHFVLTVNLTHVVELVKAGIMTR